MGIGKSRGASPLNVSNMLEEVEINQQIEAEKSEVDKLLVEIREAKETLIKFNEDLEKAIVAECRIGGGYSKQQLAVVRILSTASAMPL